MKEEVLMSTWKDVETRLFSHLGICHVIQAESDGCMDMVAEPKFSISYR
jgi:hypothetical protein